MFVDPILEIPELTQSEEWQRLRNAVLAFRAFPGPDLRPLCIQQLPEGSLVPPCRNLDQANNY